MKLLRSHVQDRWIAPEGALTDIRSAVTGEVVARIGTTVRDFAAVLDHARSVGGPALRAMTFHQRARILKALAEAIMARKEELYELSFDAGATRTDGWIDIEGGAGTFFAYSSKGRRELPDDTIMIEGTVEPLSKRGSFVGEHVLTPLQGTALHINAFNFPVWGMLEKLAPTLLAGMPAIVKPASATAYVAEAAFRIMIETDLLPKGALQLIVGPIGDLFDHLGGQDVVSFTGSASTAEKLQRHPVIARESVRFIAERDSLNAAVLAPDAVPGSPEFDLFIREIVREMTVKAGQKCTAIRRALAPSSAIDAAESALTKALSEITVGDPRVEGVKMGPLVSAAQRDDVREKIEQISHEARVVFGDPLRVDVRSGDAEGGAFLSPVLLRCDRPGEASRVHDIEPFGPVATLMPYTDVSEAVKLVNRGNGSLVMSLFTYDPAIAREVMTGSGAFHGRLLVVDRDCAKESTGHGSPLPPLVHGGPGRAGGGEEMGGLRGVFHYMQRTALQGSPRMLAGITGNWIAGAPELREAPHPFRLKFGELEPGKTLVTEPRTVTLADIEHFAHFTGDTFYAHMDEEAAAANPFFGSRVAHGYLLLSFAAGLFVDPAPGPVLANYGLDNLRLVKPVKPGDSIRVQLTAKAKTPRNAEYGEVRWAVTLTNQNNETVATYELLTMNAM
ncbi:MAG TPA: phenylacetic acid degradation bifunctional protein PaaZ [Rhizomicrobium sp.]|jgi:oxepin-CoA hydrolase/3-oxo-5,6-dehydrosuberyl-CoA semialdehyde dehydrogenase|nr:phenylacetic acid degradation bifunctional protein PaaZ [Rhizomicrobium sp.]